jgi:hypothetical protein
VTGTPLDPADLPPELLAALRSDPPNQTYGAQLDELTRMEEAMESGDLDALWVLARQRQARARRSRVMLPIVIVGVVFAMLLGIAIAVSTMLYR